MLDVPIYGRIATLELFRPHVSKPTILIYMLRTIYSFLLHRHILFLVLYWQGETQDRSREFGSSYPHIKNT